MNTKQKKLLDNTPNELSTFRMKNWIEINDDPSGTYNTNSQIKFKTSMLKSSLCDYSYAYILVKETMTITGLLIMHVMENKGGGGEWYFMKGFNTTVKKIIKPFFVLL